MSQKEFPFVFKVQSLGDNLHCIVLQGKAYDIPKANGRGMGLAIEEREPVLNFICDGEPHVSMAIRKNDDSELSFEVSGRKFEAGVQISLWSINGHPEWACKFILNSDMTISPVNNKEVVLGIIPNKKTLIHLISKNDDENKMHFEMSSDDMLNYAKLAKENEMAESMLSALNIDLAKNTANIEMLANFKNNGFIHLANIVEKKTIKTALKEINRMLGSVQSGIDQFKAKTYPSSPLIVDCFNQTFLPDLMQLLLGSKERITLESCQIALRFPGDACDPPGTCKASEKHFKNTSFYWHIDGLANDYDKGVTDHYGTVNNFDCLIGIMLADVPDICSGKS